MGLGIDELLRFISRLQQTPWYYAGLATVVAYFIIVLYKVARSEEGFVLGYRGWALGKWQRSPTMRRLAADFDRLKSNIRYKTDVIYLSRLLDGDIAYTLVSAQGRDKWRRVEKALVSGVCRVIAPGMPHRTGLLVPDAEQPGALFLMCTDGYSQEEQDNMRVPMDGTVSGQCYRLAEPVYCQDVTATPAFHHAAEQQPVYRSAIAMPVRAGQLMLGVLVVEAEPPAAFGDDDFACLEQFSAKLAVLLAVRQRQRKGGGTYEGGSGQD